MFVPYKVLAAVLPLSFAGSALGEQRPNIIFVLADDLGIGDLGPYGHPYAETPNFDRMASEGTLFKKFHVTGITCNPSRTGFMTSRSPVSFDNYPADFGFQGVLTVTEMLHDAGYTTGHFGKWHIGPGKQIPDGTYGIDNVEVIGGGKGKSGVRDENLFEAALDFIETEVIANPRKPFYVNIWGHMTHSPVSPPKKLVDRFKGVSVDANDFGRHMKQKIEKKRNAKKQMQEYLAEIFALDKLMGDLINLVKNLGIWENTIIVFSSDQGPTPAYMGSSDPYRGGKFDFYEGGVRAPFIMTWPKKVPKNEVNENSLMSALDWMPTLCTIANADCNRTMFEGEDMLDVWTGKSDRSRVNPLFWGLSRSGSRSVMMYDKWKMHGTNELYDLDANPEEDINVYSKNKDVAEAMLNTIREWERTLPKKYCKDKCKKPLPFNSKKVPKVISPPPLLAELAATSSPTVSAMPTTAPTASPSVVPTEIPTVSPPTMSVVPTTEPTATPTDRANISTSSGSRVETDPLAGASKFVANSSTTPSAETDGTPSSVAVPATKSVSDGSAPSQPRKLLAFTIVGLLPVLVEYFDLWL